MEPEFDDFKSGIYVVAVLNNPAMTATEFQAIWEPVTKYGVFQLEQGNVGHTLHYQCYFELKVQTRVGALVKLCPHTKFKKRLGTAKQASDYCKKVDETYRAGPWEWGEISKARPGARTDYHEAVALLIERGINGIIEEMPEMYFKYSNALMGLLTRRRPELRPTPPRVELHYGRTNTGKTRHYFDNYYNIGYEVPNVSPLAVNGYENHTVCLIDEYAGRWPLDVFLTLVDRYPRKINCKYGFAWWYPEHLIVTTNIHPRNWYTWERREEQYGALMRRFTLIVEYNDTKEEMETGTDAFDAFVKRMY